MKTQPTNQKMNTRTKVLLGLLALSMISVPINDHFYAVKQVKTEIVALAKADANRKAAIEANAKAKAIEEPVVAPGYRYPVDRQLPYECLSGGLSEYERDMMCGLQNDRSDQFVQNHREAFLQDENGNYVNK